MPQILETHQLSPFKLSPGLLRSLVEAQATTLTRALAECVMNSADAGATRIEITLEANQDQLTGLTLTDNGKGLSGPAEIEQYFATLGFDHGGQEADKRTYGVFGIGRAQLWAFARTRWITGTHALTTDVKRDGMAFGMTDLPEVTPGLTIHADLYTPDSRYWIHRELQRTLRYFPVPIFVEGKCINPKAAGQTWDFEDSLAKYHLNGSDRMEVFNLGVHVASLPAETFGSGGVVVSKVPLPLNLTRTALLETSGLYRQLIDTLHRLSLENLLKRHKKSDVDKAFLIHRALNGGHLDSDALSTLEVFRDIEGTEYTAQALYQAAAARQNLITITPHEGDIYHDRVHQRKLALVLHPVVYKRFGTAHLQTLKRNIEYFMSRGYGRQALSPLRIVVPVYEVVGDLSENSNILTENQLSVREKAFLSALRKAYRKHAQVLCSSGQESLALLLGESEGALGWTDARSYIALDRRLMKYLQWGRDGLTFITNVLIHELCHDENTEDAHTHSDGFYARFHNMILENRHVALLESLTKTYHQSCLDLELPLTPQVCRTHDLGAKSLEWVWDTHLRHHKPKIKGDTWVYPACKVRHPSWDGLYGVVQARVVKPTWISISQRHRLSVHLFDRVTHAPLGVLSEERLFISIFRDHFLPNTWQSLRPASLGKSPPGTNDQDRSRVWVGPQQRRAPTPVPHALTPSFPAEER